MYVYMCVYLYLYVCRGTGTYLTHCAHKGQRAIVGFSFSPAHL